MHPADSVLRVRPDDRAAAEPGRTTVEIVVPVHNEACGLGPAIRRVHAYLTDQLPFPARITIAENGSTDATWMRARELEDEFSLVRAVQIGQPGRGAGVWSQ